MMNPEIHVLNFRGAPIRAHLSNSDVLHILVSEGCEPPAIPSGCNTNSAFMTLKSGERALCVVQRGFAPNASDDECEVNGLMLLVLADPAWSTQDADRILDSFYNAMESQP